MMKMSGAVVSCCVALFLVVTSVSAVQRLNSINDLKKINFGQTVPQHSLVLLHWFANEVDINNNDVIELTFDPNRGDYGSHHYGNYEDLLNPLPRGYRYYTVGNLNQETSVPLPYYVTRPLTENVRRNLDRIIFRVREHSRGRQASQTIDQVYITQHYGASHAGTSYDPSYTYQITTNLLRQIREFSVEGNNRNSLSELRDDFGSNADDSQLRNLTNTWGNLACLGLLLFIVIEEKYCSNKQNNRSKRVPRRTTQRDFVINIPENDNVEVPGAFQDLLPQDENTKLEVVTGTNGKARIIWHNVTRHRLTEGVMVVLFKDNEGQEASYYKSIKDSAGSYDTSVPLNNGLQARLHKVRKRLCFLTRVGHEICRGAEFQNPKAVDIAGHHARLQLFVKDGKACARLYVKKSFSGWRSQFNKSWVGFYTSADKGTGEYEWWQWQWATKFKPSSDCKSSSHDVYEYHSSMVIAPQVQARFILRDNEVQARTPSWR